tara:strand:- start:1088 stop:1246 length:159 start_codon:yes stop_codon:yes gene_type:complete
MRTLFDMTILLMLAFGLAEVMKEGNISVVEEQACPVDDTGITPRSPEYSGVK